MRIILLDDHVLFGKTLQKILGQDKEVENVSFVRSKEELMEEVKTSVDDLGTCGSIILLDINLNKLGIEDSFELAESIMNQYDHAKIAFLSGYNLPMYRKKAQEIGAKGFFSKDIDIKDLVEGLKRISMGIPCFGDEDEDDVEKLTVAETKILTLSAKGYTREEIAELLKISNRTVGRHLTNIFDKLGAKNINQAVAIALDKGHIPPIY